MAISKEYITLPIGEIKPYENNPRINDDAVAGVVESIKQCGELDPIEVDENNVILSGHTRLKAYNQLGYDSISVLRITGLTEPQKRKYRLLTNKTGEVATWDFDKLETELESLSLDMGNFGFDFSDEFSIDDIQEVDGYNVNNNGKEYFTAAFTFPTSMKEKILKYLRKHKDEYTNEIIQKASEE